MKLKPGFSIEPFSVLIGFSGEWYNVGGNCRIWMYQICLAPIRFALFDYHNVEQYNEESGLWIKQITKVS